jgi:hypothetical protein
LKSFERFLSHLATIPDPRRAEGNPCGCGGCKTRSEGYQEFPTVDG